MHYLKSIRDYSRTLNPKKTPARRQQNQKIFHKAASPLRVLASTPQVACNKIKLGHGSQNFRVKLLILLQDLPLSSKKKKDFLLLSKRFLRFIKNSSKRSNHPWKKNKKNLCKRTINQYSEKGLKGRRGLVSGWKGKKKTASVRFLPKATDAFYCRVRIKWRRIWKVFAFFVCIKRVKKVSLKTV